MTQRPDLTLADFPNRREVLGCEGGVAFFDEREGRAYVITDKTSVLALLSEEVAEGQAAVSITEFDTVADREAYRIERGWTEARNDVPPRVDVRWYGERGIVNALVTSIQRSSDPVESVRALLSGVRWAGPRARGWIDTFTHATLIVELGLADFGNPDLLVVADGPDGLRLVFVEVKVAPYLASMRCNGERMRLLPGFNSSINGQLSLKYRFARALERWLPEALALVEPDAFPKVYGVRVADPQRKPRRLAKVAIIQKMLMPLGLLGLPESCCEYVALTWDAPAHAFFDDAAVTQHDGRPVFLAEDGRDLWPEMAGRIGWLGYDTLDKVLPLREDSNYQEALATMLESLEPTPADYAATLACVAEGLPEAVPLMAQLAKLFKDYDVVEYKGSFSVKDHGQTIGKIMRRGVGVFVGLRDATDPARWFPGPLEDVSVSGVVFRGITVPVDHPDSPDAAALVGGLETGSPRT